MQACKKINTRLAFLCITQMEKKWTKWYTTMSHVIAYRSKELLFVTNAFSFNCFLDDFNCVFMQILCLSVLLGSCMVANITYLYSLYM